MKTAIIGTQTDEKTITVVLEAFQRLEIRAYGIKMGHSWSDLRPEELEASLGKATHYLFIWSVESAASTWLPFLAGRSIGSGRRAVLYRAATDLPIPRYLSGFPVMDTPEELSVYYRAERIGWEAERSREMARRELASLGVAYGADAMSAAAAEGNIHALDLFIRAGLTADTRDANGTPLIVLAARNRRPGAVDFLLKEGADINARSEDRHYTALMEAAGTGQSEILLDLLERSADPSAQSKDGQTALIIAVGRNDVEAARLLLASGSDPDIQDKLGFSARKYAKLFHNPEMESLFEED